ncbi:MAG: phosphopantetheine-binding protein [Candidatus Competibacter sp.]|nr:phosphopantetheine-binding protein [Candidatus Competibacter sp.]MDS4071007.1 phosphopantetheine-binding protein [Candidatus Competibacter sp.]
MLRVAFSIITLIEDSIRDWEITLDEAITLETRLVTDLGFSSIDIVHLLVSIEEHFGRGRLGFEGLLMQGDQYVSDLTIGELVVFVERKLQRGDGV